MYSSNEQYWSDYDGLQHAKHKLLINYLGGWFPILSKWQGKVLYIDCHAGRGKHNTGHEGSPILALQLLLNHNSKSRILSSTEVHYFFFENDEENYLILCEQLKSLGDLHQNIHVHVFRTDYEEKLRRVIDRLRLRGRNMAPSFAFVDPFGFTLSMALMNDLLKFPRCELLINFMYRYVDMAIRQPTQSSNMDNLFGCEEWRGLADMEDSRKRSQSIIDLFSQQLKSQFVSQMYMRGENNALKYVLFHATNHEKGRKLMKRAMWSVTPDGSFSANERDSPNQPVLLVPEPYLNPLEDLLWDKFAGRRVSTEELYTWLLGEVYLEAHLHSVLREYRRRNVVEVTDYEGRFAFGKNPMFEFSQERPL